MIHLKLPTNDTVQNWTKFIVENLNLPLGESATYDLQQISVLRPHHLVALACLIEHHSSQVDKRVLSVSNENVKNYLTETGFTSYFNREIERPISLKPAMDKGTLNLWKLRPEMIPLYPVEAQKFYEKNAFKGKDLQALNTSLSEILNNFIDHTSESNFGFTATQHFENQHKLETAVCDFGHGIPTKINSFFKKMGRSELSDEEALRWAMEIGNSTKSTPKNRGFGLDTISNLIRKMEGELRIVSNRAVLTQSGANEFQTFALRHSFPGTLITIGLNTKYLTNKEDFEISEEDLF